jgi:hypothetical protein
MPNILLIYKVAYLLAADLQDTAAVQINTGFQPPPSPQPAPEGKSLPRLLMFFHTLCLLHWL